MDFSVLIAHMKLVLFTVVLVNFSFGGQPGDWEKAAREAGLSVDADVNTLSEAETILQWELLFNGENIDGDWKRYRADYLPMGWRVQDSSIYRVDGGGDICYYTKEYGNFVWAIEWKISFGGNSGLFYRVDDVREYATYWSGPEMQVLDNDNHRDNVSGKTLGGGMYHMYAPTHDGIYAYDATFAEDGVPYGYNKCIIVANGKHNEYWLNGIKTVEFEIGSEDWEARKADSKFAGRKYFGTYESGLFCLQDHGDKVWFRNIKVRPLPLDAPECVIWPGRGVCYSAEGGKYRDIYCLVNPDGCRDVPGCMDSLYQEYDPQATVHDTSMCINKMGCTDSSYAGYDPAATIHEQSMCGALGIRTSPGPDPVAMRVENSSLNIWIQARGNHHIEIFNLAGSVLRERRGEGEQHYRFGDFKESGVYLVKVTVSGTSLVRPVMLSSPGS